MIDKHASITVVKFKCSLDNLKSIYLQNNTEEFLTLLIFYFIWAQVAETIYLHDNLL